MSKGVVTIAGIQFAGIPKKKSDNLNIAIRLIEEAADKGAQIVMGPEVVLTGFVGGDAEKEMAESIPGSTTDILSEIAKELNIYIIFGLSEYNAGQMFNSMVVIDRKGEIMGVMRKVHINKFETPGNWRNGSEFPVWNFKTNTGTFCGGIMICYDREIPESARILMLKGADILFNPLACPCPTDDIHRCLLRTRAFENELFIFMTNHAAPSQNGHSMVINFDGTILKELDHEEEILLYKLNFDLLESARENGIYGKHHRRPDLYGLLCDPNGQIHPENANLPPVDDKQILESK
jgi:predicted amidohydrolase